MAILYVRGGPFGSDATVTVVFTDGSVEVFPGNSYEDLRHAGEMLLLATQLKDPHLRADAIRTTSEYIKNNAISEIATARGNIVAIFY